MAIRWSAVKVSEAMDMVEEFVNQAAEPLEQARIVAKAASQIANLPKYMDTRLIGLTAQIERIKDNIKDRIKSVRASIPDGAIKRESGQPPMF